MMKPEGHYNINIIKLTQQEAERSYALHKARRLTDDRRRLLSLTGNRWVGRSIYILHYICVYVYLFIYLPPPPPPPRLGLGLRVGGWIYMYTSCCLVNEIASHTNK